MIGTLPPLMRQRRALGAPWSRAAPEKTEHDSDVRRPEGGFSPTIPGRNRPPGTAWRRRAVCAGRREVGEIDLETLFDFEFRPAAPALPGAARHQQFRTVRKKLRRSSTNGRAAPWRRSGRRASTAQCVTLLESFDGRARPPRWDSGRRGGDSDRLRRLLLRAAVLVLPVQPGGGRNVCVAVQHRVGDR
jgi:hypothetical protein